VRRLTLAGVARETAAAIVAGGFFVAAVVAMGPAVSWLAGNAVSGEEALFRYLDTGQRLMDQTLALLEAQFGFLQRIGLHAEMGRKIAEYGGTHFQENLNA